MNTNETGLPEITTTYNIISEDERIVSNNEPIEDGAPIIFTERKEGVKPEYDIRTDRFELAVEAMGTLAANHLAKRAERHEVKEGVGAESIGTTSPSGTPAGGAEGSSTGS